VYALDTYQLVRRSVLVNGQSIRATAREFGINRRSVSKMLAEPVPLGYQLGKERAKPVLGPFVARIEEILRQDESAPKKQRHLATRIFERLRDEDGYLGGYCQVQREVAKIRLRSREAFVPLVSLPGEAEADFFEAWVEISGVRRKAHAFLMVLPFSGVWFVRVYPFENAESFCEGNSAAFSFFGGVPRCVVYDNPAYAVKA
jgi:transposase